MAELRTIGVKSIKIGAVGNDGGMGATLAALGVTYQGTAKLSKAEDTSKEFFCEESDDPIEIVVTKGVTTIEWAIVDWTPSVLVKVLGGTVDTTTPAKPIWNAPAQAPSLEYSIEIITLKDLKITVPRAQLLTSIDTSLGRDNLGSVQIKAKVLTPTKANTAPISISVV